MKPPLLSYRCYGQPNHPCLLLIHGFLGSTDDWQPLIEHLAQDYYCICLDLPGHGQSQNLSIHELMSAFAIPESDSSGFEICAQLVRNTLEHLAIERYWLLGYSLGGRIGLHVLQASKPMQTIHSQAADRQQPELQGLLLEGSHHGLSDPQEKQQRWANDQLWAERLRQLPMAEFLALWYQQAVFADLTESAKKSLIEYRQHNNGQVLAPWFLATSLAKQADLSALTVLGVPIYFLVGAHDGKFLKLAQHWQQHKPIQIIDIEDAGHNIHRQQPLIMSNKIKSLIR